MTEIALTTDTDLRDVPRLRWRVAEDGLTHATCVPRRLKNDHLYFHAPGKLGVYYVGANPKRPSARAKRTWWIKQIGAGRIDVAASIGGEWDGLLVFSCRDSRGIPRPFYRQVARNPRGNLAALQAGRNAPDARTGTGVTRTAP